MLKLLNIIQKNLVYVIPAAMILGVIGGGYLFDAKPLKQLIIPITFVMVYPMMATLNVKTIFKGKDLKLQVVTQLINFIFVPIVVYTIGKLFFAGAEQKFGLWAVGLFLIGVLPASGMTISWTGFAKGNKEAATKMLVFGLIIGALAAPVYTKVFMGATVDVDMLHMCQQICLFVFVPLIAGLLTRNYIVKKHGKKAWVEVYKPKFSPFSALGVTMIAFTAMALKARSILANPGDILTILVPLVVFYLFSYVFLSILGKLFFRWEDAIALLISLAYVVQIQSAAWYIKLVPWIFGPVLEESE
ncbi:MAG: bile acid:sodium symporter [Desulfoarculaceae bacterium]|nr:bile acid:sodium symporter [Desulfoarculaceae bacterium]